MSNSTIDIDKDMDMVCGCGRPVRYVNVSNGMGACNKYNRCPSYEELEDKLNQAERKLFDIKKILKDGLEK